MAHEKCTGGFVEVAGINQAGGAARTSETACPTRRVVEFVLKSHFPRSTVQGPPRCRETPAGYSIDFRKLGVRSCMGGSPRLVRAAPSLLTDSSGEHQNPSSKLQGLRRQRVTTAKAKDAVSGAPD